tara:strand:+ start:908 stop:1072 length:165 start_codon:yes stop_codon:yes gene_type:complete
MVKKSKFIGYPSRGMKDGVLTYIGFKRLKAYVPFGLSRKKYKMIETSNLKIRKK